MTTRLGRIASNSCRYEILRGGFLRVSDYHTGEEVLIDLTAITEEMLEEIEITEDQMEAEAIWR